MRYAPEAFINTLHTTTLDPFRIVILIILFLELIQQQIKDWMKARYTVQGGKQTDVQKLLQNVYERFWTLM